MNRPARALLALSSLLALFDGRLAAQETAASEAGSESTLRVYLDCEWQCDQNFLRTEIDYVDWVRNREDADVHVLVTTQGTGAGGSRYTLDFLGLKRFAGAADTLTYSTGPDDTSDSRRRGLSRVIKIGLVDYLLQTGMADRLQIVVDKPKAAAAGAAAAEPRRDPWDYWVFRLSGGGFMNGEENRLSRSLRGSLSANRTTDTWKLSLSFSGNESLSEFEYQGNTIENKRHSWNSSALAVKSISDHISVGARATAYSSSFSNVDLQTSIAPAVEYSLFPYGESTRRFFTALYAVGVTRADYEFETVYFKQAETLGTQSLTLSYEATQPWGSMELTLDGSNYLNAWNKNRLRLGGATNIRLFKGFSFNVGGNYSRIRDQIALPAKGATKDDVLLQRRQLQTGYDYFMHFGLSYSFGSIYNNVVNPRFGNSGGGMIIRM